MTDCPVMMLKDDCLLSVFSFLTDWTDKVRIEFVCQRFARLGSRYSWKGIDRLNIKLDVDDWNDDEEAVQFFCIINGTKLPLRNLSFALHSLLLRIEDNIQALSLHLRSCFDNEAGHDKRIVFHNSFAAIFPMMASHDAKFKLVTFYYTGNIAELDTIFSLIKPSSASLKKFQFQPSMKPTLYGLNAKGFYPEVWDYIASCSALEQFTMDTSRVSAVEDYLDVISSRVAVDSLVNKPLRELHIGYPNSFVVNQWITDDQYADICNNISGPGISHLTTRELAHFGGFITRLNDRARKAIIELKCECVMESVLPVLPSIRETLPNFHRIIVEAIDPEVTSLMFQNTVIGFFRGLDSDCTSRQIELSDLLLEDLIEDDFKQALTATCRASGVTVIFGDYVSGPWATFEKGNAKFMVHEVEC